MIPLRKISLVLTTLALAACTGEGVGPEVRVRVPRGAGFGQVTDSLAARHIVRAPKLFKLYAKFTGAAGRVKPGTYAFRRNAGWNNVLDDLDAGRFLKVKVVIPEGFEIRKIAPRLAPVTGLQPDSILAVLGDSATAARFKVPGPTMEGYLYPATHILPVDLPLDSVIARLVAPYHRVWTAQRKARADSLGLTERDVVTLASIIEAEAKKREEMPTIAAVYHNRLRINMPLQADPTVQYVLPKRQERLLYSSIRSVADNPYNTYARTGLPPGPIGAPSSVAIDAALYPARTDALYFVAKPDGTSVFSRTLTEHNRAKQQIARLRGAP